MTHQDQAILDFWRKAGPKKWWGKDEAFDRDIHEQFGSLHVAACARQLDDWRNQPQSSLALILLLDQFSRNLHRNHGNAFANDNYCLEIASEAINKRFDRMTELSDLRHFFYLPFMHSEKIAEQRRCVSLMHEAENADSLRAALTHLEIITRFGRFPHRNLVLGRITTPAEKAYLDQGGFKG